MARLPIQLPLPFLHRSE